MGNIRDAKGFFRANVSDEILAAIVKKIQGGNRMLRVGFVAMLTRGFTRST